jgi:hypothetical protein
VLARISYLLLAISVGTAVWAFLPTETERRSASAATVSGPVVSAKTSRVKTEKLSDLLSHSTNISIPTNAQNPVDVSDLFPKATRTSDLTDISIEPVPFGTTPMPGPTLSFDGVQNLENGAAYGLLFVPADMTGDVGPQHYVQATNALLRVFDKAGNALSPPFRISTIFAPLGTPCSVRNDGLPNVLYDALADRWLITQICSNFPPFRQLVAVSQTGDPLGGYFAYEFVMPTTRQYDFPKYGVWPDGYYMSADEFLGADYYGSGVFAFDRDKMLAGQPASYIYFNQPDPVQIRRRGMLPADLDGLRPPEPDRSGIFASFTANEYGDPQDAIRLFDFHADFDQPENSSFTERPESPIAVAAFDPTSPDGRPDIGQPAPGERLDAVSDRLNHRLAYRNHGTHESLVSNQTVRLTPAGQEYRAGVRVYEFRSTANMFGVHEQATLGDTDSSRWIASAAQDHRSNIAVQYNFVSDVKRPSILYSGRLGSEPVGQFRSEGTLIEGTGVQKAFGWRWGEYSGLSVDPVDDCTFWMTNGYYTLESETISDFAWLTRIGTFKYNECSAAPRAAVAGTVTDVLTGAPIAGAKITATQFLRYSNVTGSYGPMAVMPGTYLLTASADGYRSASRETQLDNGEAATENFALSPVPVAVAGRSTVDSESCRVNNAPEPGETVSISIGLRNQGRRDAANLTAELVGFGISNTGQVQVYGPMPVNGPQVSRPFTFTVSNTVACGALLNLRLRLRDGNEDIGTTDIFLQTGESVVAFSENFDGVSEPNLPAGWTTTTSTNHQLWRASTSRLQSPPNSAFSPAPHQMGVNELVSPEFEINTKNAELSFRNWYELETTFLRNRLYDGSVLEIKYDGGEWADIITAGGAFLSGGYDGPIDTCCSNPLGGRNGWSGRSGTEPASVFITSRVRLPDTASDRRVRLRWRIGTDIGSFREGQYIDDLVVTDGFSCSCATKQPATAPFDFDGDGKTDLSVYDLNDDALRPDTRVLNSSTSAVTQTAFGSFGDVPAYADFDGDGKTDYAVFRPSNGVWYILESATGTVRYANFGLAGDITVPADYDGDGDADVAVYRPSNGTWYLLRSTQGFGQLQFGLSADVPAAADYDGDGSADIAVFRPSAGVWYSLGSQTGQVVITPFGTNGDMSVVGDFDGDGRADLTVFRPSAGIWYLLRSTEGFGVAFFGLAADRLLRGDFDGDGKSDVAVYRDSDRVWYYLRSSDGAFRAVQFGLPGESPVPGIFTP